MFRYSPTRHRCCCSVSNLDSVDYRCRHFMEVTLSHFRRNNLHLFFLPVGGGDEETGRLRLPRNLFTKIRQMRFKFLTQILPTKAMMMKFTPCRLF